MKISYTNIGRNLIVLLVPALLCLRKSNRNWKAGMVLFLVFGTIPLLYGMTQAFPTFRILDRELAVVNFLTLVAYTLGIIYLLGGMLERYSYYNRRKLVIKIVVVTQTAASILLFGLGSWMVLLCSILATLLILEAIDYFLCLWRGRFGPTTT